jgi:hypothetical protein
LFFGKASQEQPTPTDANREPLSWAMKETSNERTESGGQVSFSYRSLLRGHDHGKMNETASR